MTSYQLFKALFGRNWFLKIYLNQILNVSAFESRSKSKQYFEIWIDFYELAQQKCFFFFALLYKRPIPICYNFEVFFKKRPQIFDEIFHVSKITLHIHKIIFWGISPMCGGHRAGTLLGAS